MTDDHAGLMAVFDCADPGERSARLREGRVASSLLLGARHPVSLAFDQALRKPGAIKAVVEQITALPALQRRRLLSCLCRALPTPKREPVEP